MLHECPRDDRFHGQYAGLYTLLPKLAQPSWVHLIGVQVQKPVVLPLDKKAAKKDAKRRYNAYKRLADAIRGPH